MSKGDVFENDFLKLVFHGVAIPDLAENDTTSPATTLSVALHTADPGESGTQLTNEATYTGYARQAVARDATGWAITGNVVNPVNHIEFPEASAVIETLTHWSVGTGVGDKLLYSGALSPTVNVDVGVIPRIKNTSSITED